VDLPDVLGLDHQAGQVVFIMDLEEGAVSCCFFKNGSKAKEELLLLLGEVHDGLKY
jgi:hypothetical protein